MSLNAPTFSAELINWAELAGYALTPLTDDGAAIFWTNPGGELRFYIRGDVAKLKTVSLAERSLDEQVEIYATSDHAIERYLFGLFGPTVRSRRQLPRISMQWRAHDLAAGFRLSEPDVDGYVSLVDADGLVAKCRGKLTAVPELVELAYLMVNPVSAITSSFQHPAGYPLFTPR